MKTVWEYIKKKKSRVLTAGNDIRQVGLHVLMGLVTVPQGLDVPVRLDVRFFRGHQESLFTRPVLAAAG